jgi:hypothetical protein
MIHYKDVTMLLSQLASQDSVQDAFVRGQQLFQHGHDLASADPYRNHPASMHYRACRAALENGYAQAKQDAERAPSCS